MRTRSAALITSRNFQLALTAWGICAQSAIAQNFSGKIQSNDNNTASSSAFKNPLLAQGSSGTASSVPSPNILPTDVTPIIFSGERRFKSRDLQFALMKKLPERLWFNSVTEISQRYESNPLFDRRHAVGDYVFRALPNVTLGYTVFKRGSIYANYFMIKDVFARHHRLTFPTFQSVALGYRHDVPVGNRVNMQFDFQARELWQSSRLNQADLIPALNITASIKPNLIAFASTLLQMRSRYYFEGATRELDPFYSVGFLWRRGKWIFSASNTFVTNFRSPPFHGSVPRQGNVSMISDYEISRPISMLPGLVSFIRAEPVWNWDSHNTPGLSGFDIRVFSGLRLAFGKPSYTATIEQIRNQIKEFEEQSNPKEPNTPQKSEAPSENPAGASL